MTELRDPGGAAPPLTIAVHVRGRRCVVVGGGRIAARRVDRLLRSGAEVTVIAPELVDELHDTGLTWLRRCYEPGDLRGAWLVVVATGRTEVDEAALEEARAAGALVASVSASTAGDVSFPALTEVGPISLSISTSGRTPALAGWLARQLRSQLADGYELLADVMAEARDELLATGRPTSNPGWEAALDAGLLELVRAGDVAAARALLSRALGLEDRAVRDPSEGAAS